MAGIDNNSDYNLKLGNKKGPEINLNSFNGNIKKNDINKSIFEKFDTNKDGVLDETECANLKSYLREQAGEDKILSKKEVKKDGTFGTKKQDAKNVFAALNDINAQALNNESTEEPINENTNNNNSLNTNNEAEKEEIEQTAPENKEEVPQKEAENDKTDENKIYNIKVGAKDTWYGIVQAKYGVTDPKKTMEIVHQLKTQNDVSKNATKMPDEINLPETIKMEDGTEVKMQDIDAKADASHYKEKEIKTQHTVTTQKNSQIAAKKAAAAARDKALRKDLGLINYKGAGDEVRGDWYKNGKKTRSQTLTKIGNATHGRTICKDKSGKVYVVAHNGVVLKDTWVNVSAHRETQVIGKRRFAVERGIRDEHGRKIVYDANGKTHVMSHDKKILKNDYVARSDKSDLIRKDSKTAQQASVEILEAQLNSAKAAFNEQMKQDGWAADVADGVSKIWNNDLFNGGTGNTASQVREEFKTYQKNLNELKLAAKQGNGAFKAKFKQIYGVEYNQKAVANYNMNPTDANYEKAFGKKNDIGQRVAKYNASQQTGAAIVKTTAEVSMTAGVTAAADTLEVFSLGTSTPITMAAIGATTFVSDVLVEGSDRYKFTGEYKDADGNIVKDDGNFRDGTNWNDILKDASIDAAIAGTTFGVGKTLTAGYKIGKATVAANKIRKTTVAASKIAKTTEKATTGIAKTTVSKLEQTVIETASDVGVSAAADYATNGEVSLKGIAMNAAVGATGFAAERLAGKLKSIKKDTKTSGTAKTEIHNVTPEAHTTGRNEIADAEIARNIDQSHLNGRDREMIAKELEAQGTPSQAELGAYAKEHAYQAPTAEERAALDAHQKQVRSEYSNTHKIENNATIKEQKAPAQILSADETAVKNIENEIGALDGQIKQLNKQLAGSKRANQMGRKNDDTIKKLEAQIEKLQQKRTAKATELANIKAPKQESSINTDKKTENVVPETQPKQEPASQPIQPVKTKEEAEALYKKLIDDRWGHNESNVSFGMTGGGPKGIAWSRASYADKTLKQGTQWKIHIYADSPQEWGNAANIALPYLEKNRICYKTIADLNDVNGQFAKLHADNIQQGKAFTVYFESEEQFLQVAKDLDNKFKEAGIQASGRVKNEAQIGESGFLSYRHEGAERGVQYKPDNIEDPYLKKFGSQSTSSNAKEVPTNNTYQPTSQERMEMGQIGNNINKAKTSTDLDRLNAQLDKMPDCAQKRNLQKQLQEKTAQINTSQHAVSSTNTANEPNNQVEDLFDDSKADDLFDDTKAGNLSNEISSTFSKETQSKLSTLQNGQSTNLQEGTKHYIVTNNNGKIEITTKLDENELVRTKGNEGKEVNSNYVKTSVEAREYLQDAIASGQYTEDLRSYAQTINKMHEISHLGRSGKNEWYSQVGDGKNEINPGLIKGQGEIAHNGRINTAQEAEEIAKKYGDSYRVKQSESKVNLDGIPKEYQPTDCYDNIVGHTHHYPAGDSMIYYFEQMHRTSKETVNLIKKGASEQEILKKIAEHYQYAANARPYGQINNSLFMNETNTLLQMAGLKTIPHGNLDQISMHLQPETFQKYFIDQYYQTAL